MCRIALIAAAVITVHAGAAVAQVPESPSPAQTLLQQPSVEMRADEGPTIRRPGWYAAGGVLVAPPLLFDAVDKPGIAALPPIPSPWTTLGFRTANDVSWQSSFLLVPLYDQSSWLFQDKFLSTIGLDLDRISTNRSSNPELDRRWQVGLRVVGLGFDWIPLPLAMGPHVGMRWERPMQNGFSPYAWADLGLLANFENGFPLLDLRGELGFNWRPAAHPGLSISVALFNENVGFVVAGFMTPGIKVGLRWNF